MNSLPSLPLIDGCLFADNSHFIEPLMSCKRKLQYVALAGRISAADKPALDFGSGQHLGCELRYCRYGNSIVDDQYFEDIAKLLSDFYQEHPAPEGEFRNLNWALEVNKRYCAKYGDEPFSLLEYDAPQPCPYCALGDMDIAPSSEKLAKSNPSAIAGYSYMRPSGPNECLFCLGTGKRKLMVEMSFALPLFTYKSHVPMPGVLNKQLPSGIIGCEIPVLYSGKIDLPIFYDGEIFINDFKTTSLLGDQFWTQQKHSSQQRGYVWAFEQLTGKRVSGYQITAIRTKEPPQWVVNGESSRKGKSQSPEAWWDESFARQIIRTSPADIAEWKNNTISLIEEFFWHYSRGYLPMQTTACANFGRCPYFDVCSLDLAERGTYLSSGLFKDNNWSPLKGIASKQ